MELEGKGRQSQGSEQVNSLTSAFSVARTYFILSKANDNSRARVPIIHPSRSKLALGNPAEIHIVLRIELRGDIHAHRIQPG